MMLNSASVKGRILDAAAQAFATHGVDQTSIDDIARDLCHPWGRSDLD